MRLSNRSIFKPRAAKSPYRIENKTEAESTVYIYDEISKWWGIDAEKFIKDFNAIKSPTIHVRINSPGGAVFDGTSIYNNIKQHKSKVIIHIDGLAASISSIIALAGDEVRMAENAFFMIHEPWSISVGTAEDMRKEADLLDKVGGTIVKTYMKKSDKEEDEIKDMMAAETWMTAQEALDNGFIDEIEEDNDEKKDKSQLIMFDLSFFDNVPDALKEQERVFSKRDIEKILTSAGVSQKKAKAILVDGYTEEQRDADTSDSDDTQRDADVPPQVDEPPAEPQRDAEAKADSDPDVQRDAEPVPEEKDKITDLLDRAEAMAPTIQSEGNPQEKVYQEYFLHIT